MRLPGHLLLSLAMGASAFAQNAAPLADARKDAKKMTLMEETQTQWLPPATTKDPNGWSFVIEPYLWAIGLSGNIGVKGFGPVELEFNPKTVLQHLDWAVMARGEIRKGRWGLIGDGFFAQLSTSGNPPAPFYQNANLRIQQGMASLALSYRVIEARQGFFDVYAGARFNYMNFNFGGDPDSSGIQNSSDFIVDKVSTVIGNQADAYLAENRDELISTLADVLAPKAKALEQAVAQKVTTVVTTKALSALAEANGDLQESLNPIKVSQIIRELRSNSAAYRELIAATIEVRRLQAQAQIAETTASLKGLAAAAKNELTSRAQARLTKAQAKFSRELARKIEDTLPTNVSGEQAWVDPIVGLRGQFNFTRWLFLAAQGDVGGFGAGADIAWATQASLGVNFTRNVFGELGYRYFYMDYANGGAVYDAAESGIFAGIGVKF